MPTLVIPGDRETQKSVKVSAIPAGSLFLRDRELFEDSLHLDETIGNRVPSLCFLIEHEVYGKVLFDLGLRKNGKGYPPGLDEEMVYSAVECDNDVKDILSQGGIKPEDISAIVYSHLHFDHIGDLTPFSSSFLIVGSGAQKYLQLTYPEDPKSFQPPLPKDLRVRYIDFASSTLPTRLSDAEPSKLETALLDAPFITNIGSYANAIDLFSDGSFFLLDAPGHFPGHLNALAHIGENKYILLAADACHHRQCYNPGERIVSHLNHHDFEVAKNTVEAVKQMNESNNVVVVLAHETERLEEMPLFPRHLNEWVASEVSKKVA